jgi:hypothetical protein
MKSTTPVNVGFCKETSERFDLTRGQIYIILDEWKDLIDGDDYVMVNNDCGGQVAVRKSRFEGFIQINYSKFRRLRKNKSLTSA